MKMCYCVSPRLRDCSLSAVSCSFLSSALRSDSSRLRLLDMSINNLQDSGVDLFSTGWLRVCGVKVIVIVKHCSTAYGDTMKCILCI
uniref:Uncharacterized protein n=1 Tax=Denticeps clupeoides TaxID=299321 RepID=A0AAY4AD88_9TELE